MARPRKMTIEYFPHFVHSGKTLFVLESNFGNDGYAFWFKLLELLGKTEFHLFDCGNSANWRFLLAKTRVDEQTATEIINTLVDLEAIDRDFWQEKKIYSENFVQNISDVYKKRAVALPTKERIRSRNHGNGGIPAAETNDEVEFPEVSGSENAQSIVKESIVKESKGNQSIVNGDSSDNKLADFIIEFWRQPQYSLHRLPANLSSTYAAIKKSLGLYGKEQIIQAIKNYSLILHSKDYLLNQNWTLARFLEHDSFERFIDIDEAKKYYARGNKKEYNESLEAIKNFEIEEVE
jgi:hypothetical protein